MLLNLSSMMYIMLPSYLASRSLPFSSLTTSVSSMRLMHKVPFSVTSSAFSSSIFTSVNPASFSRIYAKSSSISSLFSSVIMRATRFTMELSVTKLNAVSPPRPARTTANATHLRCHIIFLYKTAKTTNAAAAPKRPARESQPNQLITARASNTARAALWTIFFAWIISTSMTGITIAM